MLTHCGVAGRIQEEGYAVLNCVCIRMSICSRLPHPCETGAPPPLQNEFGTILLRKAANVSLQNVCQYFKQEVDSAPKLG